MKKFIAVSLILLMIIFAGCENNKNVGELSPLDIEKIKSLGIYDENGMCVEIALICFYNYEEYEDYITENTANGNIPEHFYPYEKLKSFGEFMSIVFTGNAGREYDRYLYSFIGANNEEFNVYIYHYSNGYDDIDVQRYDENALPQNTNDMRVFDLNLETKGYTRFIYNDIEYCYYNGNLHDITFYAGNSYVMIASSEYYKYPLNSNTFQSKLLNLETAEQAIKDIFGEIQPIEEFYATAPANVNKTADVDNIEDTFCR